MRFIDSVVVTPKMRVAVTGLIDRLGPFVLQVGDKWLPLTQALELDAAVSPSGAAIVVGSPADVLRHASGAVDEFGFVVAVAQTARWWQRSPSWRDETMLDLWGDGWTPVAIDRIVTAKQDASVEFVVGNARPTPTLIASD